MKLSAPKPWLDAEDHDLRARAGRGDVEQELVYELETTKGVRYTRASVAMEHGVTLDPKGGAA